MRVLVVGAGVIGSVYGSELAEAHHQVSVLAHGDATASLTCSGFVTRDVSLGDDAPTRVTAVSVVSDIGRDSYDLVLVCVRADQLAGAIESVMPLGGRPLLMFLGNNPLGLSALPATLPGPVHLGFPGIGGSSNNGVVEFERIARQPTTLQDGGPPVVAEFESSLKSRHFAVARTKSMGGWLAYHGVFVASIAAALYRLQGDPIALARDHATLKLMCRSIEEGFTALQHKDLIGLPRNLRTLHSRWLRPVAICYWAHLLAQPMGERCFAAHARHAEPEMRLLAADAVQRVGHAPRTDHLHHLLGSTFN